MQNQLTDQQVAKKYDVIKYFPDPYLKFRLFKVNKIPWQFQICGNLEQTSSSTWCTPPRQPRTKD